MLYIIPKVHLISKHQFKQQKQQSEKLTRISIPSMLLQKTYLDYKITNSRNRTTQKNRLAVTTHSVDSRNDKSKYPEYLPQLSKKVMGKINDLELTQISLTKAYRSQPSKLCKTETSEKSRNYVHTLYSENKNNDINMSKTRRINPKKPWQSVLSNQNQSSSFNTTNNITFHNTKLQSTSQSKNHSQNHTYQRSISKLQQPINQTAHFRTQTFQENIIRNRLKIKSTFQGGEQKTIHGTVIVKGNRNRYLKTEANEEGQNDRNYEERVDTQTELKSTNYSKKSNDKKYLVSLKSKQKKNKNNLYVPSFTHQKLTSNVVQNLLKKVQLQSQLKDYETELYSKQLFFNSPQESKLQKQIKNVQLYFKRNKKQWLSHQLEKKIQKSAENFNLTEILNNPKEKYRSEKIGRIVKQLNGTQFSMKKQTQSLYSEQRFEEVPDSEESEEKTVVLHDNSYRKEIVQLDHQSLIRTQKKTGSKNGNQQKITRIPSDEFVVADQVQLNKSAKEIKSENKDINQRPKSTESANQRNSKSRNKRKSQKRDECIIF